MDDKNLRQTARGAAIAALLTVQENEGYSNIVIDKTIQRFALSPADNALASAIFYGVLEKMLTLDFYIEKSLTNPGKKLDFLAHTILRTAVFQIYFMDRIPHNAAVNEAVQAAKDFGKPGLSGLINAVLRGLLRRQEQIRLPDGEDHPSLSIRYSIPQELIKLWNDAYGTAVMRQILEAFSKQPSIYARVNTLRLSKEEFVSRYGDSLGAGECDGFDAAVALTAGGNMIKTEAFEKGLFHVQDLSAQLICTLLKPKPSEKILDCCAAPGGKAFTVAEMMGNTGEITAYDLYKGRVRMIRDSAERLGIDIIQSSVRDMTKKGDAKPVFDKVLCDVPCSGYGVIARKPEIRYKKLKEQRTLPGIQYNILSNAAQHVKKGGLLVYSTCTLHPDENGAVVSRFLKSHNHFAPVPISLPPGLSRSIQEEEHMLTLMPFMMKSDGFFAAVFHRI